MEGQRFMVLYALVNMEQSLAETKKKKKKRSSNCEKSEGERTLAAPNGLCFQVLSSGSFDIQRFNL